MAKRLTLDTLGTALAATTLGPGCDALVKVASELGGPPRSAIIGSGLRVAPPNAALANGGLAHALNYDAVGTKTGHTGVVCLVAPLAVAQLQRPVSGARFLTAVVAAAEVTARVALAAERGGGLSRRFLSGQFFGYFGAAAGAGAILGLDAASMQSAFGLALMQIAGSRQVVIGGDPPAKAVYGAFPNHAGVLAALLAQAGLGAELDALEGEAGVFGIAADGRFDEEALAGELGTRFHFLDASFKPWPVSNHVSPFIEAALRLRERPRFDVAEIASVELAGDPSIRDWFEPPAERRRPKNAAAAGNSVYFGVGKALAHGDVTLRDMTGEGLQDERAIAVAERTIHRLDEPTKGGRVTLRMRDGTSCTETVEVALGEPTRPIPRERLEEKFRDCCAYAPSLAAGDAERLIALIDHLETCEDVDALIPSSAPAAR